MAWTKESWTADWRVLRMAFCLESPMEPLSEPPMAGSLEVQERALWLFRREMLRVLSAGRTWP